MAALLRRALRSRRGTAAIEFSLVMPVLLLLIGGTAEFGSGFAVYSSVNRLATQYAIAWADCSDYPAGTCQTELGTYSSASSIANIVPSLVPAQLTLTMFQVQMSGSTPTITYSYPSAASLTAAQTAAAQAAFTDGQVGIVVTVSYNHTLYFFPALMGPFLNALLTPTYTVTQLKS